MVNDEATDYLRKISVFPVELWELMEITHPVFPEYVLEQDSEILRTNSFEEIKRIC
jgi:hypothetical protein